MDFTCFLDKMIIRTLYKNNVRLYGKETMPAPSDRPDEPQEHEISLTQLRKNIYQLVDEVIASGQPLTLKRQGCLLKLAVVSKAQSKLGNLKDRDTIVGSADGLENESLGQWDSNNGFD